MEQMYSTFDFYEYLGLSSSATQNQIKTAYRKKSFQCHPDHGGTSERWMELRYVYEILSDPIRRASYDQTRGQAKGARGNSEQKSAGRESSRSNRAAADTFDDPVFIKDIRLKDSTGVDGTIKMGDFIYYPVTARKKFIWIGYTAKDYYRIKVSKIYSIARNNLVDKPLFVISLPNLEQTIFYDDFRMYWLSQDGYEAYERKKLKRTSLAWIAVLLFIVYLIAAA